ncbi:conserved hypothetical protein [Ricinus communis]|uniref:Uncharacterized protein n=1 Tax=Ricinus communis TaxID=3988 RepID=B9T0I8_RICCO|nr:conserved hypothetical protein [Ricinus communis]
MDDVVNKDKRIVRLGMVARDCHGKVIMSSSKPINQLLSWTWLKQFTWYCLSNTSHENSLVEAGIIVKDIINLCDSIPSRAVKFTLNNGNQRWFGFKRSLSIFIILRWQMPS